MKNMKVLSIIILSFMLVLSACSSGSGNQPADAPPTSTANTDANTDTSTPEPEEPAPNLEGRVLKFAAWWDMTPDGNSAGSIARLAKIEEVEQKYNVTIEFVNIPFDDYMDTFTTSVLAGAPFADIVTLEFKSALPAIVNGQLLPISEFTTSASSINNDQALMAKIPSLGGGEYGFDSPGASVTGLHFNRDLFQRLGLPDLQQVYHNGELTWDRMLEIAKLATQDTDNDGKTDTFGFSGWNVHTSRNLAAANGAKLADDGTALEGLSDPKTIEAVEFAARLFLTEGVLKNKSGDIGLWEEWYTYRDGDVAMWIGHEWMLGEEPFNVGVVPIPNGPSGSPDMTFANNNGNAKFVPNGVKDPHIVYQIYEETFDVPPTEEYPGQDYLESKYSEQSDIDIIRERILGTGAIVIEEAFPDFPVYAFFDDIFRNNIAVSTAAETYKQQAQAAVDNFLQ